MNCLVNFIKTSRVRNFWSLSSSRLLNKIIFFLSFSAYVTDLRSIYQTSQQPVTDDETTLHKFCVKLETALRHEQKGQLLGGHAQLILLSFVSMEL